jgi:hypothetical protein
MQRSPTTHRVSPSIAPAWLAGTAHPPGDGFEEVRRAHQRMLRLRVWLERLGVGVVIVCGAAVAVAEVMHWVTL